MIDLRAPLPPAFFGDTADRSAVLQHFRQGRDVMADYKRMLERQLVSLGDISGSTSGSPVLWPPRAHCITASTSGSSNGWIQLPPSPSADAVLYYFKNTSIGATGVINVKVGAGFIEWTTSVVAGVGVGLVLAPVAVSPGFWSVVGKYP